MAAVRHRAAPHATDDDDRVSSGPCIAVSFIGVIIAAAAVHMHSRPVRTARVAHILVATEAEAFDVMERLVVHGEPFADVARDVSTCSSGRKKGGDLGVVEEGSLAPEMDRAIFQQQAQSETDPRPRGPLKTKFGYHVFTASVEGDHQREL